MIAVAGTWRLLRGSNLARRGRRSLDGAQVTTFLVTGGAGFIGSHLCDRLLAEGIGSSRSTICRPAGSPTSARRDGYGNEFTFFNMDVRADGLLSLFERHRPEVVMHVAAQAAVSTSVQDPVRRGVNVMGLLNLMECCVRPGVRKVVYAASGGTLYGEPRKLPVKETAIGRPVSPYGISKKVGIDYLAYYEREHGVAFTALALANVYGPRQNPMGRPACRRDLRFEDAGWPNPRSSGTGIRRATTCSSMTSCTRSLWQPAEGMGAW